MGLGAVGGRECVVEVVGRVERRQRWLRREIRHEGQKEGLRGIRRTMVGQLRWVWWGVAFQGWVVRSAHSWDVAREREIVYSAVSLELEKYLLSRYRFHIGVISD